MVRAALTVALVAVPAALGGCAAGTGAQTTTMYTAVAGTDVRTGDVKGLNMLLVDNGDGTATLVAALVNVTRTDDALVSLSPTDPDDASAQLAASGLDAPVPLPAGGLVQLADPAQVPTPVSVAGDAITAGGVLQISLGFQNAGALTAQVPVVSRDHPQDNPYVSVPTPPPPSTTPEPGGGGGG